MSVQRFMPIHPIITDISVSPGMGATVLGPTQREMEHRKGDILQIRMTLVV